MKLTARLTDDIKDFSSNSEQNNVPESYTSGLSCVGLIVTAGKFNIADSSAMVPLSDITQYEFFWRFI